MIEIEGLARNFGEQAALAGVSLGVEAGQLLAVVGPNGSGKTTLFRLLLGMIGPTAGTIRLWGESPLTQPARVMRRTASMLDGHVPPAATRIRTLLDLKAAAVSTFDHAWCRELLDQLPGVAPGRRFGELSKGQKQWVLASLSLASRADLLVLDEPADGMDTAARRRLFALLRSAVDDRGTTALVASHILTDLERTVDRIVVLKSGTIRLQGDLEELRNEVREVEFTGRLPDCCSTAGSELLAVRRTTDATLAWIRRNDWHTAPTPWPGERGRRPVGLEELYLALTETFAASPGAEGDAVGQSMEVQTCS